MKNKTLLTAGLVLLRCGFLLLIILGTQSVRKAELLHAKKISQTIAHKQSEDEQGEFIIWKSIPRYLLTFNR